MSDLEAVISESLEDAVSPELDEPSPEVAEVAEASPETTEAVTEPIQDEAETKLSTDQVVSPNQVKGDDFEKKYGIPAQSATGRENRIPYSRVRKIVDKAVTDAKKDWDSGSAPKTADFTKRIGDYETKVKDYEERLGRVDQFQNIMVNDPQQFLSMLSIVPAYQDFFRAVNEAFNQPKAPTPSQPAPATVEDMPQPDQKLSDGSAVYSLEGLKKLNEWNRAQSRNEVLAEVDKRYGAIERQWQTDQRVQQVIPHIQAQITEARTWPLFNENEDEIVKVLQSNPSISLHAAYMKVAIPKIQTLHEEEKTKLSADRTKVREEVLSDLKKAPKATSVASTTSRSSQSNTSTDPRSLEDVIRESIKGLK